MNIQACKHTSTQLSTLLIISLFTIILTACGGGSSSDTTTSLSIPANFQVTAGDTENFLSWDEVTGADSYNIYQDTNTISDISSITPITVTSTSETITGLTNGTQYYYVVTAVNALTESDISEEQTAIPLPNSFTESYGEIEFIEIPSGSFQMGDTGAYAGDSDELPVHTVTIAEDFYMGKYEVTQAQWNTVMGTTPSNYSQCGVDCPVEQVSWDDVQTFITTLNTQTGKSYRLASEAEWEYAAKAGTTTDTYNGDLTIVSNYNAPILDDISYYGGNSGVSYAGGYDCSSWSEKQYASSLCGTNPVGAKQANAFGLHDMLGNVWAWTQDCYNSTYTGAPSDGSAWEAGDCSKRMLRGGSWYNTALVVRSSNRASTTTNNALHNIGFRLVISSSSL